MFSPISKLILSYFNPPSLSSLPTHCLHSLYLFKQENDLNSDASYFHYQSLGLHVQLYSPHGMYRRERHTGDKHEMVTEAMEGR